MTLAKAAEALIVPTTTYKRRVHVATYPRYLVISFDAGSIDIPIWISVHADCVAVQVGPDVREWEGELTVVVPVVVAWLVDELRAISRKFYSGIDPQEESEMDPKSKITTAAVAAAAIDTKRREAEEMQGLANQGTAADGRLPWKASAMDEALPAAEEAMRPFLPASGTAGEESRTSAVPAGGGGPADVSALPFNDE